MKRSVQLRSLKMLEAVLVAAEALIARQGAKSLTMDGVAAEAGVSKGAVLHHFPSKDALIAALVSRELAAIRDGRAAEAQALPPRANRALLAVIRQNARRYDDRNGFPTSLMVAAIENARCLDEIKAFGTKTFEDIRADSAAPDEADVLGFASLGLLLSRAFGFTTLDAEAAQRIFATMERMAGKLA